MILKLNMLKIVSNYVIVFKEITIEKVPALKYVNENNNGFSIWVVCMYVLYVWVSLLFLDEIVH